MRGECLRWGGDVGNPTLHNTPGSCCMSPCNCHSALLAHTLRTWVCQSRFTPKENIFTIAGSLVSSEPQPGESLFPLAATWTRIGTRVPSWSWLWGIIDKQWGDEDCESCLDLERGCSREKERQRNWKAKKSMCFGRHSSPGSITF